MPPPTIRSIRFSAKACPSNARERSFKPRGRAGQTAACARGRGCDLSGRDSTRSHFSVHSLFQLGFRENKDGWEDEGVAAGGDLRGRGAAGELRQRSLGGGVETGGGLADGLGPGAGGRRTVRRRPPQGSG